MSLLITGAVRGNALGNLLCQMLNAMNQGGQAAVDTLVQADTPGPFVSAYFAANGTTPAYYLANRSGQFTLVLIDGARTFDIATAFYNGYAPGITGAYDLRNSWADTISTTLQNLLIAKNWWLDNPNFQVGGFSAGGMIGQLLAYKRGFLGLRDRLCFHSFGSPRVTSSVTADAAENIPGVRWMWQADPIPLLPLRFTDAPWIVPIVGLQGALNAGRYVHWRGGWQLVANAVGHPEDVPSLAVVSPITNIAAWLFNAEGASGVGHSIAEYAIAMANEKALLTNPNANPVHVEPVEPSENQRRIVLTRAERSTAASIANAEERQMSRPVSIPQTEVWKATRLGRVWIVTLGGEQVAISASKKAARGLARRMNDSFRKLQSTAVVDPNALATQFQAYLEVASNPSGPFIPVMNTTF